MTEIDASAPPSRDLVGRDVGGRDVAGRDVAGRDVVGVVANLLAAVAVGAVLLTLLFAMVGPSGPLFGGSGLRVLDLTPAIVMLVAVGLATVPALRRYGWLVATLGLLGPLGLYLQGRALTEDLLSVALAVGVGLQLGGVLLAFAFATPPARLGIAIGLGFGLVAGLYLVLALADGVYRVPALRTHPDEAVLGVLAMVTAAAGVVLALRPAATPEGPAGTVSTGAVKDAVLAIVAAAVVARGLAAVWQLVLNDIARSSTGAFSQQRAETVEAWNEVVLLGLGVGVAVVLGVVAYRRGGDSPTRWVVARWVVVAFAVAALTIGAFPDTTAPPLAISLILPAAVGAVLGGLAVARLDRYVPWDALGVAVVVASLLLGVHRDGRSSPASDGIVGSLMIFGAAFALTAGLARLGAAGRGAAGGELALSAALGFATLLLCRQLFSGISLVSRPPDGPPLDAVLTMSAAAVALVLLFWLGRSGPASVPEPVAEG